MLRTLGSFWPATVKQRHDGVSVIELRSNTWQDQYTELWDRLVRTLRRGRSAADEPRELVRLAVAWVSRNLDPVPLDPPSYRR